MMPKSGQPSTVGRLTCLLCILCLVISETRAEQEDFDELQLLIASSDRTFEDNSIEINPNQTKPEEILDTTDQSARPRFIKSSDEPLGMDSLTVIWYLTTFTALLGFFVVMACTEKSCTRSQDIKPPETRTCPPTPCPSYKNFAPPSYETVMKKYKNQRIFIVPVHDGSSFFNQSLSDNSVQHQSTLTVVDIEKNTTITV